MEILIAFIVMLAIAVIAGVCLAVFSHFFAVAENPLKKEICQSEGPSRELY
jgi:Na+-translocating ferredoxin:NAD+ oxidoreductase RNF subunit RnfB